MSGRWGGGGGQIFDDAFQVLGADPKHFVDHGLRLKTLPKLAVGRPVDLILVRQTESEQAICSDDFLGVAVP